MCNRITNKMTMTRKIEEYMVDSELIIWQCKVVFWSELTQTHFVVQVVCF